MTSENDLPDDEFEPRPADPSARFVLLHTAPGDPVTSGGTSVDLDAAELPEDVAEELADRSIELSAPVDLSIAALSALTAALPVPASFDRSGLLRGHRVLVLTDGRRRVGDLEVRYGDVLGLEVAEPESDDMKE